MLAETEGTWDVEMKGEGGTEKGVSTFKVVCGGLWLASTFKGDFGGMAFEGQGIDGYDQDKKKFVSTWVDSMTSSPMHFEGTYDEKTKTMTQMADGKGMDGKPAKFKSTSHHISKDKFTFKMFLIGSDGKEAEMMTIEYTRRK